MPICTNIDISVKNVSGRLEKVFWFLPTCLIRKLWGINGSVGKEVANKSWHTWHDHATLQDSNRPSWKSVGHTVLRSWQCRVRTGAFQGSRRSLTNLNLRCISCSLSRNLPGIYMAQKCDMPKEALQGNRWTCSSKGSANHSDRCSMLLGSILFSILRIRVRSRIDVIPLVWT